MKDKIKKLLAAKNEQRKALNESMINSDSKEERAAIGETLAKLGEEIAELKGMLEAVDEPAGGEGGNDGERKLNVLNTQTQVEGRKTDTQAEFRAAWLKKMQGNELSDEEKRSIASANVVIPVDTQNAVITKVKELCPLLDEVQLLNVAGSVKFAVEGNVGAAALHAENGQITAAADTLVTVALDGYEIVKLVRISATVKTMSINAFEGWLTEQLGRKVAELIEYYIINGTGNSQPKGIANAATWGETNSVAFAAATPTADEIMKLIGLLPSRHARAAKFLMNRNTFWQRVMPVRDDKKMPIVGGVGAGEYNIFGYPVKLSDEVANGEMYFGNLRMVVANLADEIRVDSSEASGFATNSIDYRGTAIFDCDIADAEAFVKGGAGA